MPIKTILLHMAPDKLRGERLAVAIDLAQSHDAHLLVAYLTAPVGMPAAITGRGASAAYIAEASAIAEEKAGDILEEVRAACDKAGVRWRSEIRSGDHNRELSKLSQYADLLVVSESHGLTLEDYIGLHQPDELLIEAVCPVLIVPKGWAGKPVGRRVLIAWKDTRETSRAVRGAMGLIEQAEKVYVLTCDEPRHRFEGSKDLVDWLRQHNVDAEPVSDVADDDVGPVILSYAQDLKADLLIMGAYGHSRWREIVLGGVTHHVLSEMDLPVLMAH